MATEHRTTGLTYADLQRFPDDHLRREIIDGELLVTPSPGGRHQDAVTVLLVALFHHAKTHGGKAYPGRRDVFFSDTTVLEPDVLYMAPEHLDRNEERYVRGAPDVVVEVSSPSTRRTDLTRKLEVYEQYGVPEYWFVDLRTGRIEVRRLDEGRYGEPTLLAPRDTLTSPLLPGLSVPVAEILGRT